MSTKELGFMGNGDWEMWEGDLVLGRRRDHQSGVEGSGQGMVSGVSHQASLVTKCLPCTWGLMPW